MINQNLPHGSGGHLEEVSSVAEIEDRPLDDLGVDLVHQSRRLKGVSWPLLSNADLGQGPQFAVHRAKEFADLLGSVGGFSREVRGVVRIECHRSTSVKQVEGLSEIAPFPHIP